MGKISEYNIVGSNSESDVVQNVDALIKKGWQPYGALQVVCPVLDGDTPAPAFYQAVVKYED